VADLAALLGEAGLRVTPQRLVLLELLLDPGGHPSAEDLHRRARERLPGLSATSIYKTLHALQDAGLVREVHVGSGPVRFDGPVERHHHRVCRVCGRLEDVTCPAPSDGCVAGHTLGGGFAVEHVEVTFRGLCEACHAARAAGRGEPDEEER
jgi:Fe2+ or Zn2+ uptake regulation protein